MSAGATSRLRSLRGFECYRLVTSTIRSPACIMVPIVIYDPESLLWQSEPAHQVRIAGIGTDRVQRGITDAQNHFNFLVGERFVQIVERLVPLTRNRHSHGHPGHRVWLGKSGLRQVAVAFSVRAPRARPRNELSQLAYRIREIASRGI